MKRSFMDRLDIHWERILLAGFAVRMIAFGFVASVLIWQLNMFDAIGQPPRWYQALVAIVFIAAVLYKLYYTNLKYSGVVPNGWWMLAALLAGLVIRVGLVLAFIGTLLAAAGNVTGTVFGWVLFGLLMLAYGLRDFDKFLTAMSEMDDDGGLLGVPGPAEYGYAS